MQTISPWMYQMIKEKDYERIKPVAYSTLIIVASANLILILLAPEVVRIFAPAEYYDAIWIVPPVAMSVFFMYAYNLFAKYAFYYEKTKIIMVTSVFGALLNILLNYIFIGLFGYIAAGYTTLACYIVFTLGHFFIMRLVCNKYCDGLNPYNTKILVLITFAFVGLSFACLAMYRIPLLRYSTLLIVVVLAICFRKRITVFLKEVLSLRKRWKSFLTVFQWFKRLKTRFYLEHLWWPKNNDGLRI